MLNSIWYFVVSLALLTLAAAGVFLLYCGLDERGQAELEDRLHTAKIRIMVARRRMKLAIAQMFARKGKKS